MGEGGITKVISRRLPRDDEQLRASDAADVGESEAAAA
jgi:hypothetical protein